MKICTVPGCGNKHLAHGLCRPHYDRKRRSTPQERVKQKETNRRRYAQYYRAPGGKIDWKIRAEVAERRVAELEAELRKYACD